jgi:chemotaxis protein MotB
MQNERSQSPFRRKAESSGGEGAGMMRWLLTYADMITLLLALFIILFAISTVSKVKFQALAKEISGGFNGPYAINNPPNGGATGQQPGRAGDADLDRVKQQVDAYVKERKLTDKVETKITRQGLVISLLTDKALYDSGSADLRPETRALIDEIGHIVRRNANDIRVGGYTDDVPIATSTYPSNWELSAARTPERFGSGSSPQSESRYRDRERAVRAPTRGELIAPCRCCRKKRSTRWSTSSPLPPPSRTRRSKASVSRPSISVSTSGSTNSRTTSCRRCGRCTTISRGS